jgi:formylglycine-generating enzyme required for sulfatase activity
MVGNVYEWCATKPEKRYPYDVEEDEWRAEYLGEAGVRVLRGGSWDYYRSLARCAFRYWINPYNSKFNFGFRLVSPI